VRLEAGLLLMLNEAIAHFYSGQRERSARGTLRGRLPGGVPILTGAFL
jgi:hypothetical protein